MKAPTASQNGLDENAHREMIGKVSGTRVLGPSARKPPLSDTLLWATLSLAHPFKIEVILSKRVEVLPKQRGREAQNIVVDHLAFSAELADWNEALRKLIGYVDHSFVQILSAIKRITDSRVTLLKGK